MTEPKIREFHVVFDERGKLVWWDLPSLEVAKTKADSVKSWTTRGKLTAMTLVPKEDDHE